MDQLQAESGGLAALHIHSSPPLSAEAPILAPALAVVQVNTELQTGSNDRTLFDAGKGKVLAYTGVPADMAKTMPAGNWLKVALDVLGGKGGGKPTNAQGQGPHIDKLPEAMSAAKAHAESILS